jgi:hypothetical protein
VMNWPDSSLTLYDKKRGLFVIKEILSNRHARRHKQAKYQLAKTENVEFVLSNSHFSEQCR